MVVGSNLAVGKAFLAIYLMIESKKREIQTWQGLVSRINFERKTYSNPILVEKIIASVRKCFVSRKFVDMFLLKKLSCNQMVTGSNLAVGKAFLAINLMIESKNREIQTWQTQCQGSTLKGRLILTPF